MFAAINILLIILISFAFGFESAFKEENSTCLVKNLEPGHLLSCTDMENFPVSILSEVPSGSSCNMLCPRKDVEAWVTCDDGKWNDYYIKYCEEATPIKHAHVIKKRGWRVRIRIRRFVHKIKCFWGSRRCKPRDTTAPSLKCPPDQKVIAEKSQTWKKVDWVEPTANDNVDRAITPTRQGKGPGSKFSGESIIGYYARDKSGNMARCFFTVTVTVVRCPPHKAISNGYFQCHPSNDPRYGARCTFGCYRGYLRIGNSQLDCLNSGSWNYPTPRCQKKTCPTLSPAVGNLRHSCTDGNKYRSICTYSCASGYDITPGMSRVRVCTAFGYWRGPEPSCKDIEPPKLENCVHAVYAFANRNSTYGVVTWKQPTAIDNHDNNITVIKEGPISPGDVIAAGNYKVNYRAIDKSGNQATICTTNIIMKVLTCPTVYPTPFLDVTCPWGAKYGGQCEFRCDPGSVRNGSQIAVCEKSRNNNYGYWTWGERQPFCQVIQNCKRKLNEPKNGAVACDYWLGGKFCQMLCKSGFDVRPGHQFSDMIVCGDSGKWLPTGALPLPDCADTHRARGGRLRMSATYYFDGDCTNASVIAEIKNKFIATLSNSKYRDACQIHAKECKAENVQVKCGAVGRKRRSAELRLDFDIATYFDNSTFSDSFAHLRRDQLSLAHTIRDAQASGALDFNISFGGSMEAQDIGNYDLVLDCPEKTIPSYKTVSCVECAAGTYYDVTTETCPMCPRGTYQSVSGQDHCVPCPAGYTTEAIGGQQISHCKPGCEPGSWSRNGTPDCSLCPIGTYADQYGSSECRKCPGSTTTVEEGSNALPQCQEFDLSLTDDNSLVSVNFDTQKSTDRFVVSFWTSYDHTLNTLEINISTVSGMRILQMEIGTTIRVSNDSRTIETRRQLTTSRWQSVVLTVDGGGMNLYINGENSWTMDLEVKLASHMKLSLKGLATVSQLNIWSYNTTTLSTILQMTKQCFNSNNGDIFKWKTFEDVSDDNTFIQIPSNCDQVDDCLSSPCLNGKCVDKLSGYSCDCYYGFLGDNCGENIDDCVDHACENNATCVDGAAGYNCRCEYGYKGDLCEVAMVDGSWGDWGEWSSCSVTCGNGTQQRSRICNNPAPDNGGLHCPDNSTENTTCNQEKCPECSALEKLDHVILTCSNDSDVINCTFDCEDGYDFDHDIKSFYYCGKDTFYLWDFQTDDNPDGKTPYCSEIKQGSKVQVGYSAAYKDLHCDTSSIYRETSSKVPDAVQRGLNNVNCIATGVCLLDKIAVTGCSQRQKRSTTPTTAGFQVSLTCDPTLYGSEQCYGALYTSVDDLQTMAQNNSFDTTIQGTLYEINMTGTDATSSVSCPTGSVPVGFYCVPCGPGRYYKDDECVKCDFGTYQDRSGQLSCKECPDETTTPGRESRSSTECSVKLQNSKDESGVIVLGILSSIIVGVFLGMTIFSIRRYFSSSDSKGPMTQKPKQLHDMQSKPAFIHRKTISTPKLIISKAPLSVTKDFKTAEDKDLEVIYLPH